MDQGWINPLTSSSPRISYADDTSFFPFSDPNHQVDYFCRLWTWATGFLSCAQLLMHAIAHGGCTDTERESALKVDSGKKIPCRTGESNLCQRRAGPMLKPAELHPIPIRTVLLCRTSSPGAYSVRVMGSPPQLLPQHGPRLPRLASGSVVGWAVLKNVLRGLGCCPTHTHT